MGWITLGKQVQTHESRQFSSGDPTADRNASEQLQSETLGSSQGLVRREEGLSLCLSKMWTEGAGEEGESQQVKRWVCGFFFLNLI